MKRYNFTAIALLVIFSAFTTVKSQNYALDPKQTSIQWTGYAEAGNYAPSGTIQLKTGTISLANQKITAAKLVIDMTTISQENKDLEGHLKNEDFFDVTKYPEAVFVMTSTNGNRMIGKLTIKNISKSISFPFVLTKQKDITLVTAKLTVDRTLFNIKYNSSAYFQDLGNYAIKNNFELNIKFQFKH